MKPLSGYISHDQKTKKKVSNVKPILGFYRFYDKKVWTVLFLPFQGLNRFHDKKTWVGGKKPLLTRH